MSSWRKFLKIWDVIHLGITIPRHRTWRGLTTCNILLETVIQLIILQFYNNESLSAWHQCVEEGVNIHVFANLYITVATPASLFTDLQLYFVFIWRTEKCVRFWPNHGWLNLSLPCEQHKRKPWRHLRKLQCCQYWDHTTAQCLC